MIGRRALHIEVLLLRELAADAVVEVEEHTDDKARNDGRCDLRPADFAYMKHCVDALCQPHAFVKWRDFDPLRHRFISLEREGKSREHHDHDRKAVICEDSPNKGDPKTPCSRLRSRKNEPIRNCKEKRKKVSLFLVVSPTIIRH